MEIKVVGVGGGGCYAISHLFAHIKENIDLICIDTNEASIAEAKAHKRLLLSDLPRMDFKRDDLRNLLLAADVVILVTCLGGKTGSSISPLIAELAQEIGIPTFAFVTNPFTRKKTVKHNTATIGFEELKKYVNAFMLIPNDKLHQVLPAEMTLADKFRALYETLCDVVLCVLSIYNQRISTPLKIKLLEASLPSRAFIGIGCANGKNRVDEAFEMALSAPLFEDTCIEDIQELVVVIHTNEELSNDEKINIQNNIKKHLSARTKTNLIHTSQNYTENNLKFTIFATSRKNQGALKAP